jgi:hypothetical protein
MVGGGEVEGREEELSRQKLGNPVGQALEKRRRIVPKMHGSGC